PAPLVGWADCTANSAPRPTGRASFTLALRVVSPMLVLTSPLTAGPATDPVAGSAAAAMEGTAMDFAGSWCWAAAAPARRASAKAALDGVRAIVDPELVEGDVLVERRLAVDHDLEVVLAPPAAADLPAQLPPLGRLAGALVRAAGGSDDVFADLRGQLLDAAPLGGGERDVDLIFVGQGPLPERWRMSLRGMAADGMVAPPWRNEFPRRSRPGGPVGATSPSWAAACSRAWTARRTATRSSTSTASPPPRTTSPRRCRTSPAGGASSVTTTSASASPRSRWTTRTHWWSRPRWRWRCGARSGWSAATWWRTTTAPPSPPSCAPARCATSSRSSC